MSDIHIELNNTLLVKATVEGDVYCPDCGTLLIIGMLAPSAGYWTAFCTECKCYWIPQWMRDKSSRKEKPVLSISITKDMES